MYRLHIGYVSQCVICKCHFDLFSGSLSDDGVWANTDLANDLIAGNVPLPDPTPLPGTNIPFPFYFIGDEAFPLTSHMMRPYPRKELTDDMRIFN